MNDTPKLGFNGTTRFIPTVGFGCGRTAVRTREGYWWQSRATSAGNRAEYREVIDIRSFARQLRGLPA